MLLPPTFGGGELFLGLENVVPVACILWLLSGNTSSTLFFPFFLSLFSHPPLIRPAHKKGVRQLQVHRIHTSQVCSATPVVETHLVHYLVNCGASGDHTKDTRTPPQQLGQKRPEGDWHQQEPRADEKKQTGTKRKRRRRSETIGRGVG